MKVTHFDSTTSSGYPCRTDVTRESRQETVLASCMAFSFFLNILLFEALEFVPLQVNRVGFYGASQTNCVEWSNRWHIKAGYSIPPLFVIWHNSLFTAIHGWHKKCIHCWPLILFVSDTFLGGIHTMSIMTGVSVLMYSIACLMCWTAHQTSPKILGCAPYYFAGHYCNVFIKRYLPQWSF